MALDCEPDFDYGRRRAEWEFGGPGYHEGVATAEGMDLTSAADHGHAHRLRGSTSGGAHASPAGRRPLLRAVVDGARAAAHLRGGVPAAGLDGAPLAALAGPRRVPRPRLAAVPGAQRAHVEGPHVRAERRTGGGGRRPRCPRRRAATGTGTIASRWIRDSTFALWALLTLGFDWEANDYFWFIADIAERDKELQVVYGVDGERSLEEQSSTTSRVTSTPAGPDRQRRVHPAAARRLGRGAGLVLPAHEVT